MTASAKSSNHVDPNNDTQTNVGEDLVLENEKLRHQLATAVKQNEPLQEAAKREQIAKSQIADLEAQLQQKESDVATFKSLIEQHFKELPDLKIRLARAEETAKKLAVEKSDFESRLEAKELDCAELRQIADSLQAHVDEAAERERRAEEEAEGERKRVQDLKAELERMRASGSEAIRGEINAKEMLNNELQREVQRLKDQLSDMTKANQRMRDEFADRCSKLQQAMAQIKLSKLDSVGTLALAEDQATRARATIDKIRQTLKREKKDEKIIANLADNKAMFSVATDLALQLCETQESLIELRLQQLGGGRTSAGGATAGGPPATPRSGSSWINLNRGAN